MILALQKKEEHKCSNMRVHESDTTIKDYHSFSLTFAQPKGIRSNTTQWSEEYQRREVGG